MFAQQFDVSADPDYFYGLVYSKSGGTVSSGAATAGGPAVNLAAGTLMGKQRGAFGSFIVVNKDL